MCLILVDNRAQADLRVLANRDEFHRRPTLPAGFWPDQPEILAGRDKSAGGTWLGVTRTGRIAMLTNFRSRDNRRPSPAGKSRGKLVEDFLKGTSAPEGFADWLRGNTGDYLDFNMIFGLPGDLWYYQSRDRKHGQLSPGIYGLSNHLLDTPWPKVRRIKEKYEARFSGEIPGGKNTTWEVEEKSLFSVLKDTRRAPADELPDTGFGPRLEAFLSPMFISGWVYGTRCSTFLRIKGEIVSFLEKRYWRWGLPLGRRRFEFRLGSRR